MTESPLTARSTLDSMFQLSQPPTGHVLWLLVRAPAPHRSCACGLNGLRSGPTDRRTDGGRVQRARRRRREPSTGHVTTRLDCMSNVRGHRRNSLDTVATETAQLVLRSSASDRPWRIECAIELRCRIPVADPGIGGKMMIPPPPLSPFVLSLPSCSVLTCR